MKVKIFFFFCLRKQYGVLNSVSRAAPWVRELPVTLQEYKNKIRLPMFV
jgi:hypothetical protein